MSAYHPGSNQSAPVFFGCEKEGYFYVFLIWQKAVLYFALHIHHNDAYSASLVPYMIEMGIDIWQGPVPCNDIPKLIEQYGGQITFMGEIETRVCDLPDWKEEVINKEVERACQKCGIHSFIPCQTAGMPGSAFPGVYEAIDKAIDEQSKIMFK